MANQKQPLEKSSILWWIFGGCVITTIYFDSGIQDPFNPPKMWIILFISSWLLGHIIANSHGGFKDISTRVLAVLLGSFILFGLISAIKTDVLYTAFLGESQRRNGFLTYLALSTFMLAAALFVRLESLRRFNFLAFLTGLILAVYGLMQISGRDFIEWNNPYNAVISTVGNPNFAAAVMAMMASIVFGPVLNNFYNNYYRFASFLLTLILLFTIYLSDARQGLISFAIGVGAYILIWIYGIKSKFRHLFLGSSLILGLFAILGMLQVGPLTSILYKNSVTVRGYYWRAGVEMFKDQPLFGVGFDRYGAYFKEFRDVGYPLAYGFNITSTNAHNVPIQIFSTTGIFAGLAYMSILGFILWRGVVGIRSATGNNRLSIAAVFSAWLSYQAQSIISIDNIGISIWGWVLGGVVIGVSRQSSPVLDEVQRKSKRIAIKPVFNLRQTFVSTSAIILASLLIVPMYQVEKNMWETRGRFNPSVTESKAALYEHANKTLKSRYLEPSYKVMIGAYLFASGFTVEGLEVLKEVIKADPRNLDALIYLAEFNQQIGNPNEEIKYRLQIAMLDPYNATNFLQLGRNYKLNGEFVKMAFMRDKILSFAPNTEEAKLAALELI